MKKILLMLAFWVGFCCGIPLFADYQLQLFDGNEESAKQNFLFHPAFQVADGKLVSSNDRGYLLTRCDFADFILTAEFLFDGHPVAIATRIADITYNHGNEFSVKGKTARVVFSNQNGKTINSGNSSGEGNAEGFGQGSIELKKGETYKVRILAIGDSFQCFVNDLPLFIGKGCDNKRGPIALKGSGFQKIGIEVLNEEANKPADPPVIPEFKEPVSKPSDFNFWNLGFNGTVQFDFSLNRGSYAFGYGEYLFETHFSSCGGDKIYIYNDDNCKVAVANDAASLFDIRDFSNYDFSERVRTPKAGQFVIMKNQFNHYAVIRINRVQYNPDIVSYDYLVLLE